MPPTEISPLALALGRVPSGLFVVTTPCEGRPVGFLGSFVMQVGFEPPTLCVAVRQGRAHLEMIRTSGRFAVSILDGQSARLRAPFLRRPAEDRSPFDEVETELTQGGSTVLSEALAWLDCEARGEHATGDHVVVFGEVVEGRLVREGDPHVHVRRNGLAY